MRWSVLFVFSTLLFSSVASAQETTYAARMRSAMDAASRDRDGAMRTLREAITADPSRPDAYCVLAEVYRLGTDYTSALDNFQQCLTVSRSAHSSGWAARAAHGVASTFERMGTEHLSDARNAWLAYERLTEDPLVLPEIGRERESVIDTITALAERVAVVRGRIADREAAAAAAAGSH
jgi:hypothetical protein